MSDINQNVNINVNANTQDAGRDIEKLERNIATLDGTINIVGGSVEVLAGSLALTGAVTEEQAQKFESAAVGAIALADGSKRIIEGYRTLAKETKVLTVLQRIYNTVLKANPLFLLAGAIAAVVVGYGLYTSAQKESADATELEAKRQEKLNEELEKTKQLRSDTERIGKRLFEVKEKQQIAPLERELKLMEARGDSEEAIYKQQLLIAQERYELYQNLAVFYANDARLAAEAEEAKLQAQNEIAVLRAKRERRLAEQRMAAIKAEEATEEAAFQKYKEDYEERERLEREEFERRMAYDRERYRSAIDTANKINNTEQKILDARIEIGQIGVDAFQEGLNAIFGESKGLARAQVIIDAAQAAVGIIRKGTDPRNAEALVFPNAWIAANLGFLAATTATSLQAINSASAEGGGAGGTNYGGGVPTGGGLSGPGYALGAPTIGGTSGVTALQAIVLAGDVTSAQAQEAAIRNRRRFG